MHQQDSLNQAAVLTIIDQHGWVGKSKVGKKANRTLWLVVQHASLEVQEKYLPLLKASVEKGDQRPGESEGWYLAYLEDSILMRQGKKQKYGSQAKFNKSTGKNHNRLLLQRFNFHLNPSLMETTQKSLTVHILCPNETIRWI